MHARSAVRALLPLLFGALPIAFLACGARTPLLMPDEWLEDGGADARRDARRDVVSEDAGLPPIDASRRDASRIDCLDAGEQLIYVVTSETSELVSFDPAAATFKSLGVLTCPAGGATPFSMAVDRKGIAYVLYRLGQGFGGLFRVSPATLACTPTPFKAAPGFETFGMGFATIGAGPAEELFIIANDGLLGKIDVQSFGVTTVGTAAPTVTFAELTGTGDGRLYAYYLPNMQPGSAIAELDKTTGAPVGQDPLPTLNMNGGWAFAAWGGDFYIFTGTGGAGSIVSRFRPSDKSLTKVASYPALIVGAGVSTCAPSE
jgi:hypothetical protein